MTTVTKKIPVEELPIVVLDQGESGKYPPATMDALRVGDTVVIHSRGSFRFAVVEKLGKTRVYTAYTTESAWKEAEKAAERNARLSDEEIERRCRLGWDDVEEKKRRLQAVRAAAQREGARAFVNVTRKSVDISGVRFVRRGHEGRGR